MTDRMPSDDFRLQSYQLHGPLWERVQGIQQSVGYSLDDLMECFTERKDKFLATVGLDWLSEVEIDFNQDKRLNTLLTNAGASKIPNIADRLILGRFVRRLRRHKFATGNTIAPRKVTIDGRQFSFGSVADFLEQAKMRRVICPVVYKEKTGHLLWVEVFSAPADKTFPSGIHLAPWSFHHLQSPLNEIFTPQRLVDFQVDANYSLQVSFQPLRGTDFGGEQENPSAAASSFMAPIHIDGPSISFAVALAVLNTARGERTFRRIIATGIVENKSVIGAVTGAKEKSAAVRDFWKMDGTADWFFYPEKEGDDKRGGDGSDIKFSPLPEDTKWRSVSSLNDEINGLLTDGFDGYRTYLARELGRRSAWTIDDKSSLEDLLKSNSAPTVAKFNDSPEALARDLFDRLNSKLLAIGRGQATLEDKSAAAAHLPDQEIFILLPREQVPDCNKDLPKVLRKILVKKLEESRLDPPEQSDIERKQTDGKLCLVVYTEPSFQFPADAAETRLSVLRDLEARGTRVILVCPDAHLRWAYEQTGTTQTDGHNGMGGQSIS